jgi:DNA-directed RNA polymerase subunit beta'
MKRLVDLNYAQNIKSAKRMVERARPQVWDVLEEVIADHPVLLNRAPTLHRLGIQAFMPVLVEGKAIQLHPLVCTAFNADFDGDQMAVHLPLSAEAQSEARILMLASNNILSPATGRPIASPTQDMVLGIYWLTFTEADTSVDRDPTGLPMYSSIGEVERAVDDGVLHVQDPIVLRLAPGTPGPFRSSRFLTDPIWSEPSSPDHRLRVVTTAGRAQLNDVLPPAFPYVNQQLDRADVDHLVVALVEHRPHEEVVSALESLKDLGLRAATRSGTTVALADIPSRTDEPELLQRGRDELLALQQECELGLIGENEYQQRMTDVWLDARGRLRGSHYEDLSARNPWALMVRSGAQDGHEQFAHIACLQGQVLDAARGTVRWPILSSMRQGLSVLEHFTSTYGTRMTFTDAALRTEDGGNLRRRLVDAVQDLIVREDDCGDRGGLPVVASEHTKVTIAGRVLAADLVLTEPSPLEIAAGTLLRWRQLEQLSEGAMDARPSVLPGSVRLRIRSVLTCGTEYGVCRACYGEDLTRGAVVELGVAVGIVAAQSIGEPGMQLTLRTHRTGGVASADDITQGLPRVVELLEARRPRGKAEIARIAGRVELEETDKGRVLRIHGARDQVDEHELPRGARLFRSDDHTIEVADGLQLEVGQQLTVGAIDPHELLEVLGVRAAQLYLVREVQDVFRSQGVPIHDKHVELVVRQMFRRVNVVDAGDTTFLPGDNIDRVKFKKENDRVLAEGGQPAAGRQMLMGITEAALATDSWLSAASFQDTTRVLTEAALGSASDPLVGLKENVIIGKLIPAGTGIADYRSIEVGHTELPEQALPADIAEFLASTEPYESDGSWGFESGWGFQDFLGDT